MRGLCYPRLILERLGSSPCKFWRAFVYFSKCLIFLHISEFASKNTRKIANKSITVASGDIFTKYDLICHVAKVKDARSVHSMADVIFCSNPTLWKNQMKIHFTHYRENNIRVLMFQQVLAYKHQRLHDSMSGRAEVIIIWVIRNLAEMEFGSGHRQN